MIPLKNPLAEDLNHILTHTRELWEELRDQRIFVTGGTGFIGCWILESFAWANDKLRLNAEALVLTRNYEAFLKKAPHLVAHLSIKFHIGDVRNFQFPTGQYPLVIHAAHEANARLNEENSLLMWDTIIEGTRHVLEFARQAGTKKFLLTSSGVVYGKQPPDMTHIPEEYTGAPDTTDFNELYNAAYGEGKRAAEILCTMYSKKYGIQAKIARCFASLGPYLPLDIHYAIGNFIRDRLHGRPIEVKGDGTPYRSYLYASELTIWLWNILLRGVPCRPYNVGSECAITIKDLAQKISISMEPAVEVHIAESPVSGQEAARYVPLTKRAQSELNLRQEVDLMEAIIKTNRWYSSSSQ